MLRMVDPVFMSALDGHPLLWTQAIALQPAPRWSGLVWVDSTDAPVKGSVHPLPPCQRRVETTAVLPSAGAPYQGLPPSCHTHVWLDYTGVSGIVSRDLRRT
ncbi:MAG: hypothetical protein EOM90_17160 [Alphaproteobacteria bacterium]|nr:hypothetical protein [Alphaproteobacteria bacterium]